MTEMSPPSSSSWIAASTGRLFGVLFVLLHAVSLANCDIDYNTINEDGSYSFRHSNDDIGGYYHNAAGTSTNVVRGRYGSKNAASGRVEETVYSAGPRGFRAQGPKIHRKMDLAQYPVGPIGSPDDPLADPYDDPSYSFQFRTPDQSRSEDNDATNRVRGLYSYLDDVGDRHTVRYAAGAGTGFEVLNAVPDTPVSVGYTAPLYKAHPQARGKMSVQRGPDGSYKLVVAGPDHRRAESRGPDGLVRGTYSFLDDKGVQRTVEYIAGAGIGYRVVQNRVGPGTHLNPSVADFRFTDNDILDSNIGRGGGGGGGSGDYGSRVRGGGSDFGSSGGSDYSGRGRGSGVRRPGGGGGASGSSSRTKNTASNPVLPSDGDEEYYDAKNSVGGGDGDGDTDSFPLPPRRNRPIDSNVLSDRRLAMGGGGSGRGGVGGSAGGTGGGSGGVGGGGSGSVGGGIVGGGGSDGDGRGDGQYLPASDGRGKPRPSSFGGTDSPRRGGGFGGGQTGGGTSTSGRRGPSAGGRRGSAGGSGGGTKLDTDGYHYPLPESQNNYHLKNSELGWVSPLVTANQQILQANRDRDWAEHRRDSTIIRNVGKWYIGLPPGQSVRAHVQNIDLLPLGGRRVPSPSEALRQDEIADMVASIESHSPYKS